MKIAIFGGSFDPPHIGHEKIVQEALKKLDIDKIILVPTFLNPLKERFFAPANKRKEWLEKIFSDSKKVEISEFEIEKNRAVATYETVKHFKERLNPSIIYLIIGSDNYKNFHKWQRYEELLNEVVPIIATRDNDKIDSDLKKLDINVNISSSKLRENLDLKYIPKIIRKEVEKFYGKEN